MKKKEIDTTYDSNWASQMVQVVKTKQNKTKQKNLPAMKETQDMRIQSLSWEYPLEKEMATHSSILAWRILWTEEPGRPQSIGSHRVGHN